LGRPCGTLRFVAPTIESISLRAGSVAAVSGHEEPGMAEKPAKQLLHLVLGGELSNIEDVEFRDLDQVDIVGLYPNYASAYAAWKNKAQKTVDNAQMRYFIVHLHRLLDPDTDVTRQPR
jgi:hypothetical protein